MIFENKSCNQYFLNIGSVTIKESGFVLTKHQLLRNILSNLCRAASYKFNALTHFMPPVSFYTHWKHKRTRGFWPFSKGYRKR